MTAHLAAVLQDALGPDYHLEHELEGGGMSRLYLATDVRLNRRVVVKALSPELTSATDIARFKREIELTVRLQHPHILPLLTTGSWADGLYYIAPFIPGESLRARIDREGKLPLDEVLRILHDVSGALAFAHQRSIVHRDVKPGNILLADGNAILADFGIARAVSTTATPLTGSGMTPGTPAYMAPELPTDERADVYALGVVGYEMLCGALPQRGATAREIVNARGSVAGDTRGRLREVAQVLAAAMSPSPETRLVSAHAMCERLDAIRPRRGIRWPLLAAAAGILAVLAVAAPVWNRVRLPTLNPNRYVVVSLGASDSLKSQLVSATNDVLEEWQGITAIDGNVTAATNRRDERPLVMEDLRSIGRALEAQNVVVVDGKRIGDSIEVRATLYAAVDDSAQKVSRVAFSAAGDAGDRITALRRLVNALVRDGDDLPWHGAGDQRRPVVAAWRAYDAGRLALRQWRLAAAETSFRRAIELQPSITPAHLWLAQTLLWMPGAWKTQDIRASARRVLDARPTVDAPDSLRAAALLAMTDDREDVACAAFLNLIAADSSELSAWIGLGDCRAYDPIVLPAEGAASGWRFRGSYEAAAKAYDRARDIGAASVGSEFQGWALGRLSRVLYTATNKLRIGRGVPPDTTNFAALPYLDHDTLSFTPVPMTRIAAETGPAFSTIQAAVTRSRNLLRRAAEAWVRRSPENPAAYDTLASWTEVSGGLAQVAERQVTTLDVLRRGIALSRDPGERLRLAIAETRMLVKTSAFEAARAEADSLMRADAKAWNGSIEGVVGLAALLGRVEETSTLLARASGDPRVSLPSGALITPPAQVLDASARLVTYASFGVTDSIPSLARRTMEVVRSYFPDSSQAAEVQSALVLRPLTFAYPAGADLIETIGPSPDDNAQAFVLLAHGDTAAAMNVLAKLRRLARAGAQGTAIENNLRRARLALFLGDTTGAIADLDPVLRALPTLGPRLFTQVPQVAALVRALALRAELAKRAGDRQTVTECATAVIALWRDADPVLQPLVTRMKQLLHGVG